MVNVYYQKNIAATPKELRDTLLDHQNLSDFFNASFKVLKAENDNEISGGKGCVREVTILGVRFKEEIVRADTNGIEYRVVDDFPVKAHRGVIAFTQIPAELNIEWLMTFLSKLTGALLRSRSRKIQQTFLIALPVGRPGIYQTGY